MQRRQTSKWIHIKDIQQKHRRGFRTKIGVMRATKYGDSHELPEKAQLKFNCWWWAVIMLLGDVIVSTMYIFLAALITSEDRWNFRSASVRRHIAIYV